MNIKLHIATLFLFLAFGCKQKDVSQIKDAATLGTIEIWCDESIKKIVEQEEDIFESSYKYADVKIIYASENKIKNLFYADSLEIMIISGMIDSNDIKIFNSKKVYPRQYKFATSALAFITSKGNKLDTFTEERIIELLKSDKSETQFVIENSESGIANSLLSIIGSDKLGAGVFAKKSKKEVIDWINKNPNSIGIIDWSEISDSDDPEAKEILNQFKLIGISTKKSKGEYLKPYQYNLNGAYPFTRDLYLIKKYGNSDVSLGFASFICSERGQKIVLKAGLLPTYQTERWIEFKGLKDVEVIK